MRAAVLTAHGRPPTVAEHPDRVPGPDDAVVAVTAAPIVPLDLLCASGTSYFGAPALPYVPGVQGVGRVRSSPSLPEGTRVWFPTTAGMAPGDGSLATEACVPDAELVALPDELVGVTDPLVAAMGLSAIAAWMVLTWRARLQPGEQVLVLGAGGVVGQVAVQAARLLGARRVVAACRSEHAQETARARGADAVVALLPDEGQVELAGRLAAACDGPIDVVVDPLFGVPASAAATLLGRRGRLVNLGSSAAEAAVFGSGYLRSHTASILGYTNNDLTTTERNEALLAVLRYAAAGDLTVSHRVVPFDDVALAWAAQADGSARERLVLEIG
ncbi:zinc-binding dehydrogenase [Nocardioides sp. CER19]|uniref:quinone oxidoreductase family protein n=1 Tax=Nocardioides sp. CER19 TaxID=3038538 RepID=UPI0024479619|nr:zinc-binding dehydrogenase [Nocardioides sp. CER19]MDH2413382.1 zinc-binding dehydrogenase [Nocardioides sp. CER19]